MSLRLEELRILEKVEQEAVERCRRRGYGEDDCAEEPGGEAECPRREAEANMVTVVLSSARRLGDEGDTGRRLGNDVEGGDLVRVEELPDLFGGWLVGVVLVVGDVDAGARQGTTDGGCCRGCRGR